MIYKAIRGIEAAAFVWFWFLATYLVWLPLDAVTNRVTFVFYFLPTAPAICIGLGIAISTVLNRLGRWRANRGRTTNWIRALYAVVGLYLLVHLAIFVIFNPAVPTFIKTWLPPLEIGVDTNRQSSQQSSKDIHLQISRFS
jgi:dolichyl-phosphate-mannose--protein O-mannosyl transferase